MVCFYYIGSNHGLKTKLFAEMRKEGLVCRKNKSGQARCFFFRSHEIEDGPGQTPYVSLAEE